MKLCCAPRTPRAPAARPAPRPPPGPRPRPARARPTHRRRPHLADARLLGDGPDLVDEGERVGELLPAGLEHRALGRRQELAQRAGAPERRRGARAGRRRGDRVHRRGSGGRGSGSGASAFLGRRSLPPPPPPRTAPRLRSHAVRLRRAKESRPAPTAPRGRAREPAPDPARAPPPPARRRGRGGPASRSPRGVAPGGRAALDAHPQGPRGQRHQLPAVAATRGGGVVRRARPLVPGPSERSGDRDPSPWGAHPNFHFAGKGSEAQVEEAVGPNPQAGGRSL